MSELSKEAMELASEIVSAIFHPAEPSWDAMRLEAKKRWAKKFDAFAVKAVEQALANHICGESPNSVPLEVKEFEIREFERVNRHARGEEGRKRDAKL